MSEHVALILVAAVALPFGVYLGAFACQRSMAALAGRGEKVPLEGKWYYLVPEGDAAGDLYAENRAYRFALSRVIRAVGDSEVTMGELDLLAIKGGTAGEAAEELREIRKALADIEPAND